MLHGAWIRTAYAALAMLPVWAVAAPTVGVITVVDGAATVWRDTQRFVAVEGLRLKADDIVITADDGRLLRAEFDDGMVVDLGPSTQAMLWPHMFTKATDRSAALYLARGWAKVAGPADGRVRVLLAAARLESRGATGTAMLHVGQDEVWLFIESGIGEAASRRDGHGGASLAMKAGDSFVQRGPQGGGLSRVAPADLLAQMPRPFADTLPRRASRFANTKVEPTQPVDVDYAQAAPWINGEPALRAAFVQRLSSRAREPHFRSALVADLKLHPEWQRVLFPPPPPPAADADALNAQRTAVR